MKLNLAMPRGLRNYYQLELESYNRELSISNLPAAWRHLERAHILGQAWFTEHTHVHWLMLKFGIRIKNRREIIGQLPRLLVGGVKSFVGAIPTGNTGGANVPPLRKMEIPEDLQRILERFRST
ncbi:MAG: DUF3703 domain-containing protein [Chitinophagaceae bacterium]|nr:DUF3703 domain-containing protein [Chitinophagaceae bacterium]